MAVDQQFVLYLLDQLSELEGISHKKMFGGVGYFYEGKMFGAIMPQESVFRLKVNDTNRAKYEAAGMQPWENPNSKQAMPYYTVPDAVLEDRHELAKWAQESIKIALS